MTPQKRILITGGTRGIGRALVARFAKDFHVITCGRQPQALADLTAPNVTAIECHLDRPEDRDRLVRAVNDAGPLDGLINNAAVQGHPGVDDRAETADLEHEIAVNLVAPIALGRALLPQLKARRGFIVNVGSGLGYVPLARTPVYCATKAALAQYTKAARLRHPEVHWMEVVLPMVDTPMTAGRGQNKISADAAARAIQTGIRARRDTLRVGKARLLPWLLPVASGVVTRMLNRAEPPVMGQLEERTP